jgi:hypothetical protein
MPPKNVITWTAGVLNAGRMSTGIVASATPPRTAMNRARTMTP